MDLLFYCEKSKTFALLIFTENVGNQVEEGSANLTVTMTVLPGLVKGGHSRVDSRPSLHKLFQKDLNKKTQGYKVESVSGGANMDMHNFSLENKRETEYVSHITACEI